MNHLLNRLRSVFIKLGKTILSLLPPTFPNKIYNTLLILPPFSYITHLIIKSIIPPTISIEEGILSLNKNDVGVSGALALNCFENTEVELFRQSIKPGMTVVDIGANIGYYTLIAGTRVGDDGHVFAFEPEEVNYNFLEKNVRNNSLEHRVNIYKIALSDRSGQQKLYLTENNKGTHSFADNRNTNTSITVETKTLDEILLPHTQQIDIIKMDIEGAEALVIDGMKELINKNPHVKIFTEFYPKAMRRLGKSPLEFLKKLHNFGFKIYDIDETKKTTVLIGDYQQFLQGFPDYESFRNLLAVK